LCISPFYFGALYESRIFMAEIEKIEALEKIIKKEYPNLNEEEISLRASQFMELGRWLVLRCVKDQRKPNKSVVIPDFQGKTENPTPNDDLTLEPQNNHG